MTSGRSAAIALGTKTASLPRSSASVHRDHTCGFPFCDSGEAFAHAREEGACLLLEAVLILAARPILESMLISSTRALHAGMRI